jgi:hypothetical protein
MLWRLRVEPPQTSVGRVNLRAPPSVLRPGQGMGLTTSIPMASGEQSHDPPTDGTVDHVTVRQRTLADQVAPCQTAGFGFRRLGASRHWWSGPSPSPRRPLVPCVGAPSAPRMPWPSSSRPCAPDGDKCLGSTSSWTTGVLAGAKSRPEALDASYSRERPPFRRAAASTQQARNCRGYSISSGTTLTQMPYANWLLAFPRSGRRQSSPGRHLLPADKPWPPRRGRASRAARRPRRRACG